VPVRYSYTSTPPIGSTACTEPQCLYSTAVPLFPYGPYGPYRASVPVQYSYTSSPPIGRTACTEPQCLYSTAIPLLPLWAVRTVQSLSACTVQLYVYSPYRQYSLYRASVPVQEYNLTLPYYCPTFLAVTMPSNCSLETHKRKKLAQALSHALSQGNI